MDLLNASAIRTASSSNNSCSLLPSHDLMGLGLTILGWIRVVRISFDLIRFGLN